jgi:hypothetical protein
MNHKLLLWYGVGEDILFAASELRFPRRQVEEWLRAGWCHHAKGYKIEDDGGYLYFTEPSLFALITDLKPDLFWLLCPECFGVNGGDSCCVRHRRTAEAETEAAPPKYRSLDDD